MRELPLGEKYLSLSPRKRADVLAVHKWRTAAKKTNLRSALLAQMWGNFYHNIRGLGLMLDPADGFTSDFFDRHRMIS